MVAATATTGIHRPGAAAEGRDGREVDMTDGTTTFEATLIRWSGAGGWVFAQVPQAHAPDAAGPFGRVPVTATVDGRTWPTSVWRDRRAGWLLPVPARIRAGKDDGDTVSIALEVDPTRR
ncbi:DUF1905 domain-containing protein [Micromonospora sp. NPDC005806]|uniref:DUF1905 domain-containing protein n=1 Tax=Micromonospora sp. NPDC005806 TaxID=3364234 RepID=UPI0036BBA6C4